MRRIVSIAAALLGAFAMSLTAFAEERAPQPYGQNKDHWCWAAAAKMVAEHNSGLAYSKEPQQPENKDGLHSRWGVKYWGEDTNGNITVDGVQRSIVMDVKKTDVDQIGYLSDMRNALECASAQIVDVGQVGKIGYKLTDKDINDLKVEIRCRQYVLAGCYDAEYKYGHVVVVTDYNSAKDQFTVFDPWGMEWTYPTSDKLFNDYTFTAAGHPERMEYYFYSNNSN